MGDRSNRNFFGSSPSAPLANSWFWGASGTQNIAGGAGQTISPVANRIVGVKVIVPFAITIAKVSIRISALSAGGIAVFALYSADGNTKLLQASFSTSAVANLTTTLATPVTIPAGVYIYCYAADNATAQAVEESIPNVPNYLSINQTRFFSQTANPMVAGVMPATLGALTASTLSPYILCLFEA
jgi:hypothetical protein